MIGKALKELKVDGSHIIFVTQVTGPMDEHSLNDRRQSKNQIVH